MATNQETVLQYVTDMLSLTNHIHEAIERQKDDENVQAQPEATRLINKIDGVLEGNISALEQHAQSLGGDAGSPIKNAVASIAGVAAGLLDKVRTETVTKMLRDDYTALSLSSISYTLLHTTALALKHSATADLALAQLKNITPLIVEISEVIPKLVVPELTDDGLDVNPNAGEESIKQTQEAWSSENVK